MALDENKNYYSNYDSQDRNPTSWNIAELDNNNKGKTVVQNIPDFGDIEKTSNGIDFNSFRETMSRRMKEDGELIRSYWAAGLYRRQDMSMIDAFHRFPRIDPFRAMPTNREYAFFVKPNLHIFQDNGYTLNEELNTCPFFTDLMDRGYAPILRQLQANVDYSHPFINILTNRKISNIDVPTIQAEDIETGQNFYGTRIKYRRGTERSDEECDFSVEFEDTKYLEIYLLFKAFDEYEKRKWYGLVTPPDESYIQNKVLHDQIAVYKFVVGEDGETLIYWAKYIGVYPVVIPRDIFSDIPQDGHLKITIQFRSMFIEDMMPNIFEDFNELSRAMYSRGDLYEMPLWDQDIMAVDGRNVYIPRVRKFTPTETIAETDAEYSVYKLKWYGSNK